jgi:hypothetical protein
MNTPNHQLAAVENRRLPWPFRQAASPSRLIMGISAGCLASVLAVLIGDPGPRAQTSKTVNLQVSETTGIRRTEYPVSARVDLARGALADLDHVRLRAADADVAAQYSVDARWEDGSVRTLGVDFNASIGPAETRTFQLEHGPEVNRSASVPRGLSLVEDADAIQVGNVRFSKRGYPLILSAQYRGELIGNGPNGFSVDVAGFRRDLSSAGSIALDVVKRGPLLVVLRYSGRLPIDEKVSVPFSITCEMPNSKSWVKFTATLDDPSRRVTSLMFDTPLALGDKPWTWDFGTDSGTYGVFRNATDTAALAQTVTGKSGSWVVQTGPRGELRFYETSTGARIKTASGWGHILDGRNAVAFAIERFASEPGLYNITLDGEGRLSFSVSPATPKTSHRLTVYEHFVSTPVAIGAATNPTAMLSPLVVKQN